MANDDFDHIIDDYLRYVTEVKGLSAFTESTYRADLRSLREFFYVSNTHPLSKFDREGVRTYLSWLTNLGYERASVVRKLSVLRGLFKWLLKQGYVDEDPVPRYSVMRKGKKLPKFLSIEEVERFFRAIEEDTCSESVKSRDIAIFELFYSTGIRVREMSGLDVGDVDVDYMQAKVLGKGSRERMAIFGVPAQKALLRYLEIGRPYILTHSKEPALFVSQKNNRLSVRSIQSRAKKYSIGAGLGKDVHPHMVRHSFATHMIDGGADLRVVQELLGHASPVTTQTYLHVTGTRAKEIYEEAHPFGKY
jgi:integrase/recombinase XerC